MTPVVCDASVVVAWVVDEADSAAARSLPRGRAPLLAPSLLLLEVANALLSRRRRGEADPPGHLAATLNELRAGSIAYTGVAALLDSAATIAERESHPIYDCIYLALARRQEALLATFDRRLATLAQRLAIPLWSPAP